MIHSLKPPVHLCLMGDATSPHIQRWTWEMRQRGFQVSLVTARPEPIDGVVQRILTPVRRSSDWLFRVAQARRYIAELAPDIVHAHYATSYGYLAVRCGRHPLVITAWGSDLLVTPQSAPWMRWLTAWVLRRADLITGDSESLIHAAQAYRPRCAIQAIHWGVNLAQFKPLAWQKKKGVQLISLRAWEPNYNIDTIIEALALLQSQMPGAALRLHLLGGGSMQETLYQLATAKGVADQVVFHGRLNDAQMASVLADCKISITVPSSDATSVAMLESMACGLAVVASDLDANTQWLDQAVLVPARNAHLLAQCLQALVMDEERMQRIGAENAQRMLRDGDRAVQMDRMAYLYQQLLETP